APAENMKRQVLESLAGALEKRVGLSSVSTLHHLAELLGDSSLAWSLIAETTNSLVPVQEQKKIVTLPPPLHEQNAEAGAAKIPRAETSLVNPADDGKREGKPPESKILENGNQVFDNSFRRRIDAFGHLLRTGTMPWWADTSTLPTSGRWFGSLLERQAEPLLQTLRAAVTFPQAADRLLRYVPRPDLKEIIHRAAPEYGGLLLLYIKVGAGLAEDPAISATQHSRVAGLHWRETLL